MDVDIDLQTSFKSETIFPLWARACVVRDGKLTPHPCGAYPQFMPRDPVTHLAAIPYDAAEDLGYLKIDFLHLTVYDYFKTREEIEELLKIEPEWSYLLLPSVQEKLFQLSKHGDLLNELQPRSIEELADALALIRPGKRELLGLYKENRLGARKLLYSADASGYSFKKSHAVAYALVIVLQLHLVGAGVQL